MRFCPFCSAETAADATACAACQRRLPPPPTRRAARAVDVTGGGSVAAPAAPSPTLPVVAAAAAPTAPVPGPPPRSTADAITTPTAAPAARRRNTSAPPPIPGSIAQALAAAAGEAAPSTSVRGAAPPPLAAGRRPAAPPTSPPPPGLAGRRRDDTDGPPPTQVVHAPGHVDRPYAPSLVIAVPEAPERGPLAAARYAVRFARARWQRRGAVRVLGEEIRHDTGALDAVLGSLGRAARAQGVGGKALADENAAIGAAELRRAALAQGAEELAARRADEELRFEGVERERLARVGEAEGQLATALGELGHVEGQRRSLRDKRKELDRRQRAYEKAADDRDGEAGAAAMGAARDELRRAAEGHRQEAKALTPEAQEVDRKLAALEEPGAVAQGQVDAAKADLEAARRSLTDAREGTGQRLAELDAEQKRWARDLAEADAEIQRRLVTLGTLVNLNRVGGVPFVELYERIDRIRGAIAARTAEIDKLTAERTAYDRAALIRGYVAIVGAMVVAALVIVVVVALI